MPLKWLTLECEQLARSSPSRAVLMRLSNTCCASCPDEQKGGGDGRCIDADRIDAAPAECAQAATASAGRTAALAAGKVVFRLASRPVPHGRRFARGKGVVGAAQDDAAAASASAQPADVLHGKPRGHAAPAPPRPPPRPAAADNRSATPPMTGTSVIGGPFGASTTIFLRPPLPTVARHPRMHYALPLVILLGE